jgi:phosphoglycerate dehydrogenase-like enzyme
VVLSAPATTGTHRLVDAAFLAAMKPDSVLVNVGRGTLVDESALLAALDTGTPSAAVLDVFEHEPLPPDHRFWTHPRVRVTPHNAAGGFGRLRRQADLFAANLDRWLAARPLEHDVTDAIQERDR